MGVHENGVVTTVAEAYLSVLMDRGVSRLFVNAGTDFAPIVEAYARQKQSGLDFPELVVCAHENLAISMAHGAYLGDGRVQAVMVHTSVGTANAVCGTFNAATDRIPILLAAGRSPLFEDSVLGSRDGTIHWAQEMYDQASVVREFVKWDYELRDGVQVAAVLDRAIDIAMPAPRGPVYLSLPREVLARDASGTVPPRQSATPTDASPAVDAVDQLASTPEFHDHYLTTAWGDASAIEKLITLVMEASPFSDEDVQERLSAAGVPQPLRRIRESLEILRLYALLDRDDFGYRFGLAQFPRILRESGVATADIRWLAEEVRTQCS